MKGTSKSQKILIFKSKIDIYFHNGGPKIELMSTKSFQPFSCAGLHSLTHFSEDPPTHTCALSTQFKRVDADKDSR